MSEQTSNNLGQQHDSARAAAVEYWDRWEDATRDETGATWIYNKPCVALVAQHGDTQPVIAKKLQLLTEISKRECQGLHPRDKEAWCRRFISATLGEHTHRGQARQLMALLASQCRDILEEVAKGWAKPRPTWGYGWCSGHSGDTAYEVNGWAIVVFWDCGDWDYIDSVTAPDGRKASFEDFTLKPDDMLCIENRELFNRAVKAFEQAQPELTGTATDARPRF